MRTDEAIEIVKNIWPSCGMLRGRARCNQATIRKLIWPNGESVFLCEDHKNDLLVADCMQSIDAPQWC